MSYTKLIAYSVIPVLVVLVAVAYGSLLCAAIGLVAEAAVIALFVGTRRKLRLERETHARDRGEPTPTRRTA